MSCVTAVYIIAYGPTSSNCMLLQAMETIRGRLAAHKIGGIGLRPNFDISVLDPTV